MSTSLNTLISSANIKNSYFDFLSKQDIEIFCPFIKYDTFKAILEHNPTISRVISRWDPHEIVQGASDIEVYKLCKEHGIDFYINKRIHLKATIKSKDSVFHSSANLSSRGLNHNSSINYNHELSTILKLQGIKDLVIFEGIVQESIFVTDEVYEMMADFLTDVDYRVNEKDPFPKFEEMKQFYISQLPTSMDLNTLFEIYSDRTDKISETEINCAVHDLAIYNIEEGLDYSNFIKALENSFFIHPFINGLMTEVETEGFIYFGRVKQWLQDNCQDVPVPKRRELTETTQVLYKWIEVLGGEKYEIDRPNHSQRIKVLSLE